MKLIKHMIVKRIGNINNQSIIVNTLTSFVGILFQEEATIVINWMKTDSIKVKTDIEKQLYDNLLKNRFLVENDNEEHSIEKMILSSCREKHFNFIEQSHRLILVLTYMCNFDCPYCFEKENCTSYGTIMSKEQVDRIFELNKHKIDKISLFGGEPLLPVTKEIIAYIFKKAPNETYSITTNGYYLDEFIHLLLTVKISFITITLDGKSSSHNATRKLKNGSGTFDRIISNINLALKSGLSLEIRMNITEHNKEECLSLKEELKMQYHIFYESHKLFFNLQPVFQQSNAKKIELNMESLYNLPQKGKRIAAAKASNYIPFPLLRNLMIPQSDFTPKYCNCDSEEGLLIYDAYGDMYSCPIALGNKNAVIGTYYPHFSFKKDSMINRNIESIPECRNCINKFVCGGGCANELIKDNKPVFAPDCSYMTLQIDHLIAFAKRELDKHAELAK